MKRDDIVSLALSVGVPLLGGQIAGLLSIKDVKGWYKRLRKPRWTPPDWLFGAVWPVLYVGQGVASWLVWKNKGVKKGLPLGLYGAQLLLNLAWQPIMFKAHRPDIALADSSAMLGLATAATVAMTQAAGDNNVVVASLMSPYVAWLAYATALTYRIWKDNPNAAQIDSSLAEPLVPPKVQDAAKKGKQAAQSAAQAAQEELKKK